MRINVKSCLIKSSWHFNFNICFLAALFDHLSKKKTKKKKTTKD